MFSKGGRNGKRGNKKRDSKETVEPYYTDEVINMERDEVNEIGKFIWTIQNS